MYTTFTYDERRCRMVYTTFNSLVTAVEFCRSCDGFGCVYLSGTNVKVWDSRD